MTRSLLTARENEEATMESVVFEVVTKAGLLIAGIVGFIAWANAGFPFYTISLRK